MLHTKENFKSHEFLYHSREQRNILLRFTYSCSLCVIFDLEQNSSISDLFFIFNSFLHFGITSMVRNHKSHLLLTTNLCSLRTVQSNCTANRLTRSVCILWVIQNDFYFFQFFFSWWRLILIGWQLLFRVVWCDFAGILTHRKLTMRLIDNQQTTQSFTLYRPLQKCAIRNRSLPIPLTDDKRLAIN